MLLPQQIEQKIAQIYKQAGFPEEEKASANKYSATIKMCREELIEHIISDNPEELDDVEKEHWAKEQKLETWKNNGMIDTIIVDMLKKRSATDVALFEAHLINLYYEDCGRIKTANAFNREVQRSALLELEDYIDLNKLKHYQNQALQLMEEDSDRVMETIKAIREQKYGKKSKPESKQEPSR